MADPGINFTVKEYLARIEAKLDRLDERLTEIGGRMTRLDIRASQLESKMHELDEYGSQQVRALDRRVQKLEGDSLTKQEVVEVLKEREKEERQAGGHRLSYIGAIVTICGLLVSVIFLLYTMGGST